MGEDRDRGGNLAKVKVGRRTRNLHEVWDYVLLERLNLPADSLRPLLARSLAADPAFIARHSGGTVEAWVDETHAKTAACYLLHGKRMRKGIAVSLDRTYLRAQYPGGPGPDQNRGGAPGLGRSIAALDPALRPGPSFPPSRASARAVPAAARGSAGEDTAAVFPRRGAGSGPGRRSREPDQARRGEGPREAATPGA